MIGKSEGIRGEIIIIYCTLSPKPFNQYNKYRGTVFTNNILLRPMQSFENA